MKHSRNKRRRPVIDAAWNGKRYELYFFTPDNRLIQFDLNERSFEVLKLKMELAEACRKRDGQPVQLQILGEDSNQTLPPHVGVLDGTFHK